MTTDLTRNLQLLRDDGKIEFLARGIYRLLDDDLTETVSPGDNADFEPILISPIVPYSVDDILADGCFIERTQLEKLLERLRTKKNLILQGLQAQGKHGSQNAWLLP